MQQDFTETQTEHIYIGDEYADMGEPQTVSEHLLVKNCVNGKSAELTFFDEGFLKVRESHKENVLREYTLQLCFMDPRFYTRTYTATGFLLTALATGFLALLASYTLPTTQYSSYSLSATAVMAAIATLSLLLFVYKSDVQFQFRTAIGQASVLTLTGSFGCIRKTRAAAKAIVAAVRESRAARDTRDISYLRAEMRAHYELAKSGVISEKDCSDCTAQILARFG